MKKILITILLLLTTIIIINICINPKTNNQKGEIKMKEIYLKINENILTIELDNNETVSELLNILEKENITIEANDYGNFEKVGSLGYNLKANDKYIKTEPGDIMLYNGNQITIFYESNSWEYTKIGKIKNITKEELKNTLGEGKVTLTLIKNN